MTVVTAPTPALASVTFALNASVSSTINCSQGRLAGILMPAAFDGTTISFLVSDDGTNFNSLTNADGSEYTATVAPSKAVLLPMADFYPFQYVQLRSGTASSPTNQTSARSMSVFQAG